MENNNTEVAISNYNLINSIEKNYQTIDLEFCGIPVKVSNERSVLVAVKKAYQELATILKNEFSDFYEVEMPNMDKLSEKGFELGLGQIYKAVAFTVDALINKGIYDVDESTFASVFYSKYCTWDDDFESVNEKYMEIVLTEDQKDAYRKARRQNRGKWVGGGFGIEGAMKGAIQAGAMNLATGAVHGMFNLVAKGISSVIADGKKTSLYNNPKTKETLLRGVWTNIYKMSDAYIDALSEIAGEQFDNITEVALGRAERLYNNLDRIVDDKKNVIAEILSLNPYYFKVYEYIIDNNLDTNSDL